MNKKVIKDLRAMEKPEVMSLEDARKLATAKGFTPKAIEPEAQTELPPATEGTDEVDETSTPTTEEVSPMAENKPKAVPGTVEESSTVAADDAAQKQLSADMEALKSQLAEQQSAFAKQQELIEQQTKALEAANAKAEANAEAAKHLQLRAEVKDSFNAQKSLAHGLMNDSGKLTPAAYKHLFGADNEATKAALNGHIQRATGEEAEGPTLDQISFYLDMVSQFGETKAAFTPTSKPNLEKPNFDGVDSVSAADAKAELKEFAGYAMSVNDRVLMRSALVSAKADNDTDLVQELEAVLND